MMVRIVNDLDINANVFWYSSWYINMYTMVFQWTKQSGYNGLDWYDFESDWNRPTENGTLRPELLPMEVQEKRQREVRNLRRCKGNGIGLPNLLARTPKAAERYNSRKHDDGELAGRQANGQDNHRIREGNKAIQHHVIIFPSHLFRINRRSGARRIEKPDRQEQQAEPRP